MIDPRIKELWIEYALAVGTSRPQAISILQGVVDWVGSDRFQLLTQHLADEHVCPLIELCLKHRGQHRTPADMTSEIVAVAVKMLANPRTYTIYEKVVAKRPKAVERPKFSNVVSLRR